MARNASWGVEVTGKNRLGRALALLGDGDAPFLRKALDESGKLFEHLERSGAPRHIVGSIAFVGVTGAGANQKAIITAKAPDARRQEFGRAGKPYRTRGSARGKRATYNLKAAGYTYKGSKERPYIGVKRQDHAIAAAKPQITEKLTNAIHAEWERLGSEAD